MSKALEAQQDQETANRQVLPPPPAYSDAQHVFVDADAEYDAHNANVGPSHRTSARSYASPAPLASMQQSESCLTSRSSRRDITASLKLLYHDIILRPTPATADVFRSICETCRRSGVSIEAITASVSGKLPIYWMVVHASKMPGTIEVYLSQRTEALQPTTQMLEQALEATLVHDDMRMFRMLNAHKSARTNRNRHFEDERDTIELVPTEAPNLGFLATITIKEFKTRLQTHRTVSIPFVCRHRAWRLHLGQDPDGLAPISTPASQTSREPGIKLWMQAGDAMDFRARIRLRHPRAAIESAFLSLGRLQYFQPQQKKALQGVAWCGIVPFSRHKDWKALTLGESTFLGPEGTLDVQLHVQAGEAQTQDCLVQ
jgi:hypothetical protein